MVGPQGSSEFRNGDSFSALTRSESSGPADLAAVRLPAIRPPPAPVPGPRPVSRSRSASRPILARVSTDREGTGGYRDGSGRPKKINLPRCFCSRPAEVAEYRYGYLAPEEPSSGGEAAPGTWMKSFFFRESEAVGWGQSRTSIRFTAGAAGSAWAAAPCELSSRGGEASRRRLDEAQGWIIACRGQLIPPSSPLGQLQFGASPVPEPFLLLNTRVRGATARPPHFHFHPSLPTSTWHVLRLTCELKGSSPSAASAVSIAPRVRSPTHKVVRRAKEISRRFRQKSQADTRPSAWKQPRRKMLTSGKDDRSRRRFEGRSKAQGSHLQPFLVPRPRRRGFESVYTIFTRKPWPVLVRRVRAPGCRPPSSRCAIHGSSISPRQVEEHGWKV